MAHASVNQEAAASLGVKVTEGEGNLPKVVLTSAGGR
jgi:glucose-6-phosphate 1-epimerase